MQSTLRDIHAQRLLILDFGSQYTQLIARRVRECGVYCEIYPFDIADAEIAEFAPAGVILSGGPETVTEGATPRIPAGTTNSTIGTSGSNFFINCCRFRLIYI